jgi:hypothetical protein
MAQDKRRGFEIVDDFPFMLRHSKHSEPFFSSLLGVLSVRKHPIMATLPASRIVLAVLGFNAMGDASRDILDPRMLNNS